MNWSYGKSEMESILHILFSAHSVSFEVNIVKDAESCKLFTIKILEKETVFMENKMVTGGGGARAGHLGVLIAY